MGCGGQTANADFIENYPALENGIAGYELAMKLETQAKKFGLEVIIDEVSRVVDGGPAKHVFSGGISYLCKSVIIASGADHTRLSVTGEKEFLGKGVSYCATCDGAFYKDKTVVVIGGGDSAVQEALFLTRFAKKVIIVHRRDKLRATAILQARARSNPKIDFKLNSVVMRIEGGSSVERIVINDALTGSESTLQTDGIFIYVGLTPNTGFIKDTISLDPYGYILTDDHMKTSVAGIYACGDVRKKLLRQVVTATGDGATAAFAAQEYIDQLQTSV